MYEISLDLQYRQSGVAGNSPAHGFIEAASYRRPLIVGIAVFARSLGEIIIRRRGSFHAERDVAKRWRRPFVMWRHAGELAAAMASSRKQRKISLFGMAAQNASHRRRVAACEISRGKGKAVSCRLSRRPSCRARVSLQGVHSAMHA